MECECCVFAGMPGFAWPGEYLLVAALLRRLLAHPLTKSLDSDDPATTELRKEIISTNPFLTAIYDEWYTLLAQALPSGNGRVLELGSGGGYCARFIPDLITSEIFSCSSAQMVLDAQQLPFANGSLRAIVMSNVMHHLPDVRRFLAEACRCLRPEGKILTIEPWMTSWSRFIYKHLHHEPFLPDAADWGFTSTGPLSGANMAMPWIVLERDREKFEAEFPDLLIEKIRPFLPFRYLVSGGVTMRPLMPGFSHKAWRGLEQMLEPEMGSLGLFAFIQVRRR
jgi:SAM-dependent methyltransferase